MIALIKQHFGLVALGIFIVVAVSIHGCSTRYYYIYPQKDYKKGKIMDRWTGRTTTDY